MGLQREVVPDPAQPLRSATPGLAVLGSGAPRTDASVAAVAAGLARPRPRAGPGRAEGTHPSAGRTGSPAMEPQRGFKGFSFRVTTATGRATKNHNKSRNRAGEAEGRGCLT